MAATPAERRLAGQSAAHTSWANTENRSARTAPARAALDAKFLAAADGDPGAVEGYLRVSDTGIECLRLPLVPVIVSVYGPLGELREVETFKVTLVEELAVKEAVALLGNPLTVNATVPLNPFSRVIVML